MAYKTSVRQLQYGATTEIRNAIVNFILMLVLIIDRYGYGYENWLCSDRYCKFFSFILKTPFIAIAYGKQPLCAVCILWENMSLAELSARELSQPTSPEYALNVWFSTQLQTSVDTAIFWRGRTSKLGHTLTCTSTAIKMCCLSWQ